MTLPDTALGANCGLLACTLMGHFGLQGYEKLPDYEAIMTEFLRAVAEGAQPKGQSTGYGPATFAACSQL